MPESLTALNVHIFLFLQELIGQSWLFDRLISLATDNQLVKAVVIGCCFIAAWSSASSETAVRTRKILVLTIVAGVFAIGFSKLISKSVMSPRPLLFSSTLYLTHGESFEISQPLALREPLDDEGKQYFRDFKSGVFDDGDLESFPSDHAALYVSLAVGVLMAHRGLGLLSLAWAIVVILLPRAISGMHWPLDLAAGALIGTASTVVFVGLFARRPIPGFDGLIRWSLGKPGLSSALLFAVIFEACNSYYNLRLVLKFAREAARYLIG